MLHRLRSTLLLIPALALLPCRAPAVDLADGKLTVDLTGQVGYGRTNNGNTYTLGNEAGQYDNTVLAVSVAGQVSESLRVVGRFDLEAEGAEIDWAFAEWKVNDALRFRAGMAKHPFGNYGEILEEGTLRPFFDAPQSIYGLANIVGEGFTGVGLTGFHRLGESWALSYDLYGGELDVETSNALGRVLEPTMDPAEEIVFETRELIGGRVTLETPIDGLVARVSAYTGVEAPSAAETGSRHSAVALSGEYLTEALSLRAEYALMTEAEVTSTNAAYLEAAWLFRSGFQVAGRVEGNWSKLDAFSGSSPNLRHREATAGLNYWFAPDFVVKAEYHLIDGNRFAYAPWPEEGVTPSPIPVPSTTTQLFFIGAQFSL